MQWRTQDFIMGGVEVPQAPRGMRHGGGVSPFPLGEWSGKGLCVFVFFFVENTIF